MGEVTMPISLDFVRILAHQASTSNPCVKVTTLKRSAMMCVMSTPKTASETRRGTKWLIVSKNESWLSKKISSEMRRSFKEVIVDTWGVQVCNN